MQFVCRFFPAGIAVCFKTLPSVRQRAIGVSKAYSPKTRACNQQHDFQQDKKAAFL